MTYPERKHGDFSPQLNLLIYINLHSDTAHVVLNSGGELRILSSMVKANITKVGVNRGIGKRFFDGYG